MALHWDFKCKAGIIEARQQQRDGEHDFTLTFYEGNALMITTYEYNDNGKDVYDMVWFFTGTDHAKRCLGLAKCDDGTKHNMLSDTNITRITIYRNNCRQWKTIVDLFTKAFPDIMIELMANDPNPYQPKEENDNA